LCFNFAISAKSRVSSTHLKALDYNDPEVASEFQKVQNLPIDWVEEEITNMGIPVPATMNEMDIRLMCVELRMRAAGKMPSQKKKKKKTSGFSSKFDEALNTNDRFEELYNKLKAKGDHNSMNVAAEYVNAPDEAQARYGKEYENLLADVHAALFAPKEITSPVVKFSGFPANMGADACRMTLEALGPVDEFDCSEDEDFPVLKGEVKFVDIETAKKAIEQYDGMDMGMGSKLEFVSV